VKLNIQIETLHWGYRQDMQIFTFMPLSVHFFSIRRKEMNQRKILTKRCFYTQTRRTLGVLSRLRASKNFEI